MVCFENDIKGSDEHPQPSQRPCGTPVKLQLTMFLSIIWRILAIILIFQFFILPLTAYLLDKKKLRRFPSVSVAAFTNAWGVLHQYFRTRTLAVHYGHLKHGPIIRIGPSHVSFATLDAIRDIYGHGTLVTKDNFYGAFVSSHLNVSDAQEKSVHNVKRKRFAAAFSQKSIAQLEPIMDERLVQLVDVLDNRLNREVDMKQMMLCLMYDMITVMLFAQDPKFLQRQSTMATAETLNGKLYETDLHQALCGSLHLSTSVGWAPQSIKIIRQFTSWHDSWKAGDRLRDLTVHLVRNRLRMDTERVRNGQPPLDDFMTTMLWDRNREALGLELGELVTEAQNLFNAAGENTEIALTNIVWLLARNPNVVATLRQELDKAFAGEGTETVVPKYDTIKDLPYLRACIDEALRLRPSLPGGLPRVVPEGGMRVSGEWLEGGTTVSVSTHTVHRDCSIFYDNPCNYVPERWLQTGASQLQRGFLAFSQGGRACIGRNIAYYEMQLIIATLFHRYDFRLRSPDWELGIDETFSAHTKPLPLTVTLRT